VNTFADFLKHCSNFFWGGGGTILCNSSKCTFQEEWGRFVCPYFLSAFFGTFRLYLGLMFIHYRYKPTIDEAMCTSHCTEPQILLLTYLINSTAITLQRGINYLAKQTSCRGVFRIKTAHLLLCVSFLNHKRFFESLDKLRKSRDSSVSIALGYGLDDRGSRVRFPTGAGNFSLHHRVQNSSGVHPASYPMCTRSSFPGGKTTGA
jgi:hypothetical protein